MESNRIFIIEDLFTHRKLLTEAIHNIQLPNLSFDIFPIEEYEDFYNKLVHLTILDTDIFIIDIDLKSFYNGIDYAKRIRTINLNCFIIFMTASDQQGINIINEHIHATSYLVKDVFTLPVIEKELKKELLNIRETLNQIYIDDNDRYLFVKTNESSYNIKLSTILYIETIKSMKGYLHMKTLSQEIIIKSTISELREKLNHTDFLVTNLRSIIINLHTIKTITPAEGQIVFVDDTELFVGRKILKKINTYIH